MRLLLYEDDLRFLDECERSRMIAELAGQVRRCDDSRAGLHNYGRSA
jgi:hypothetical protein